MSTNFLRITGALLVLALLGCASFDQSSVPIIQSNVQDIRNQSAHLDGTVVQVSGYLWYDSTNNEYHLFTPNVVGAFCTFKLNEQTVLILPESATKLKSAASHFVTLAGRLSKRDPSQDLIEMIPSFAELKDVRVLQVGRRCQYKDWYAI